MSGVNEEEKTCTNSHDIFAEKSRRETLVLDAGPHVVSKGGQESVSFNPTGNNQVINGVNAKDITYPKQFPKYNGEAPENEMIESLGDMETDAFGRLIVIGAYGKASGFKGAGIYDPHADLESAVNNDCWFDDTADGPVTAVLAFTDGTSHTVEGSSWVVTSDPSYAPQIANVVSLWEDMYNTWVEKFDLEPSLFTQNGPKTPLKNDNKAYDLGNGYNEKYAPKFESQVKPILNAANLQMWATNLVSKGEGAHKAVAKQPMNDPQWKEIMDFIRNPNAENNNDDPQNATRMPLSLGDSGTPADNFLAISRTQYFFLYQWLIRGTIDSGDTLGAGELLDRNILGNCLGGRFSPGIEMTFIIRDTHLYQNWKDGATYTPAGPFRIDMDVLDYNNLQTPALGVGYTPVNSTKVEPGDICKFMSIPWHTDYNSCATHTTVPNEQNSKMTYWSWPAQRPVAVYTFEDIACNETNTLGTQRYSVRGEGTNAYYDATAPAPDHIKVQNAGTASARVGRYQEYIDFVANWHNVGTIIQGSSIEQTATQKAKNIPQELLKESFLEVQSNFKEDDSNKVVPGPIAENHSVANPPAVCPHMASLKNK